MYKYLCNNSLEFVITYAILNKQILDSYAESQGVPLENVCPFSAASQFTNS